MKKQPLRKIISIVLCLTVLSASAAGCSHTSSPSSLSSSHVIKEQKSFDDYTREFFIQEVKSNTINLHYTLSDPEAFGIKRHPVSFGSLSEETLKNSTAQLENMSAVLSDFDYDTLTTSQQLTYDILNDYCTRELKASSLCYYNEPLRPTTGTQSELPVLLAEYAFYKPSDVTDYLSLLSCIEDYFNEIIAFEQKKSQEGLFMSDYAADTVIKACNTFITDPEKNYLIGTFNSRIDAMTELSDEKKAICKKENETLVLNAVVPAYKSLAAAIASLKGTGVNDAGLCNLPKGCEYYEYLVRCSTGSDKNISELQNLVETRRDSDIAALQTLLTRNPSLIEMDADANIIEDDPAIILEQLQKNMQKDFFPAANSNYEINYVDESLEETSAPAFYLTAPIDDLSHNVIYINKSSNYSGIQLFTTLAHEGYPGHLYQTTGSHQANSDPIRALFNYPGYVEGWATYVEMLSYHYAGLEEDLADMLMYNQSALLSLYATIDMRIHYDGWKLADVTEFLSTYGITDQTAIQSIYELVVEEPAHYLKYYIGYLEFLELKENAQEELKENYSNRAFHQAVVRIGPTPFDILKAYLRDFYES